MIHHNKIMILVFLLSFVQSAYAHYAQEPLYEEKYNTVTGVKEKPIAVVVCSYNNHEWTKRTLDSIFTQNYQNFRLIIVDDCSSDGNQEIIQHYIDDNNLADRVTFIANKVRYRKLFNLYRVLYDCSDEEIVTVIDGDDFLAHDNVFSYLNTLYDNEDVWFSYGQYKNEPASQAELWGFKEMGYCRLVPKHILRKHAYRQYAFIFMHLRSFRGWIFKLVKLQDLIADKVDGFEGDFYPAANDNAMYFPVVEMAHQRVKFVPDVMYTRNLYSDIVGFKVDKKFQTSSAREIRKKVPYSVLVTPKKNRLAEFADAQADMFIVCKDDIDSIATNIHNVRENIQNIGTIYILCMDTDYNKALCRKMKQQFTNVVFVPYSAMGGKSLKNRLLDILGCSKLNHFILASERCQVIDSVNVSELITDLEKTFAYRFYLSRDAADLTSRHIILDGRYGAWKFGSSARHWDKVDSANEMVLHRKSEFMKNIRRAQFVTFDELVNLMNFIDSSDVHLGLFFKDKKIQVIS